MARHRRACHRRRGRRIRPADSARPSAHYVNHVGFTLIALFDAFAVIIVLDLGAPIWLVVAAGVLIAAAGRFALRTVRARLVDSTDGRRGVTLPG